VILRSVLRKKPHLRKCLKRCRHCRIYFLTSPRNAARPIVRCPFGCREAHRKQQSTKRSVAYNRTAGGKRKKADLNNKRRRNGIAPAAPQKEPDVSATEAGQGRWDRQMVEHVRMVISLIEDREVSREEILEVLRKDLRQHSLPRRRKIDQAVSWLNENPP
jgi:hypothetical protein